MEAVKLGADWSHLIEYQNMTRVRERMKLLHCMVQDMEALAKMLASASKGSIKILSKCARPPFGPLQNGGRKWAGNVTTILLEVANKMVASRQDEVRD